MKKYPKSSAGKAPGNEVAEALMPYGASEPTSVSDLELIADLPNWLAKQAQNGRPLAVTHEGRTTAILVPPGMFDYLIEQRRVVSLILEGLQDSVQGNLVDDDEVWADVDRLLADHGVVRVQ